VNRSIAAQTGSCDLLVARACFFIGSFCVKEVRRSFINIRPLLYKESGLHLRYNNSMPNPKKPRPKCPVCGKEPDRATYKYCSNACQMEFQHRIHVDNWKKGKERGLNSIGLVSGSVKRYLRRKYNNKCCICGWAEINTKTGIVPLVADHIDGNWMNNVEENLRLICPNCDALSPTFAALNKGNGRKSRARSKRAADGQVLARKGKSW